MGLTRSEKPGERTPLALAARAAAILAVAGCTDNDDSKLAQARAALNTETAQKIAVILVTGQDPWDEFITLFKECSVQEKITDGKTVTDTVCASPANLDEAEDYPTIGYQGRQPSAIMIGPYHIEFFEKEGGLLGKIVVRTENGKVFQLDETNGLPPGLKGSLLLEKGVPFTENPRFLVRGGGEGSPIKTVFNTSFDANGQLQNITLDGQWDIMPGIPFAEDTFSFEEELFSKGQLFIPITPYKAIFNGISKILKYTKSDKTGKWEKTEELTYPGFGDPHYLANFPTPTGEKVEAIAMAQGKNIKVFKAADFESGNFDTPLAEFNCEVTNRHLGIHPKGWLVGYGAEGLVIFDPKDPEKMLHYSNIGTGINFSSYFYKFEITETGKLIMENAGKIVTITTDNPFDGSPPESVLKIDKMPLEDVSKATKSVSTSNFDGDKEIDWYDKEPTKYNAPPEPSPEPANPEPIAQPDAGSTTDTATADDAEDSAFAEAYNEIPESDAAGLDDTADGNTDNLDATTPKDVAEDTPKVEDNGFLDAAPTPDAKKDGGGKDAQPPDAENPDAATAEDVAKDTRSPLDTSPSNDIKPTEDQKVSPVELEAPIPEWTLGNDATAGEKDLSQNPPPPQNPANTDSGGCAVATNAPQNGTPTQRKSRFGELLITLGGIITLRNLRKKERTE